jgi:hypothetical protein
LRFLPENRALKAKMREVLSSKQESYKNREEKLDICVQLTVKYENGNRMGEKIDRREKK